mmetsp:Transcript_65776/g.130330  ORF Transcript_65776/g.130330 Transcript_65776/m.130330 type:complete len:232 (+) Transcript_65776:628-1323(+)
MLCIWVQRMASLPGITSIVWSARRSRSDSMNSMLVVIGSMRMLRAPTTMASDGCAPTTWTGLVLSLPPKLTCSSPRTHAPPTLIACHTIRTPESRRARPTSPLGWTARPTPQGLIRTLAGGLSPMSSAPSPGRAAPRLPLARETIWASTITACSSQSTVTMPVCVVRLSRWSHSSSTTWERLTQPAPHATSSVEGSCQPPLAACPPSSRWSSTRPSPHRTCSRSLLPREST